MTRFPDWPERLNEFIEGRRERPFSWGANDCALFAADAIVQMTGVDLAKPWRGYRSERGALTRIQKAGGLREIALAAGLIEKPAGLAQRGDVVLVMQDGRETFGIVAGNGYWCGPGVTGIAFRPLDEPLLAVFQV